jgi:neuromedin U receptor 1
MSKLSRVVKFIFAIWILAFALAAPQAFQFGTVSMYGGVACTVKFDNRMPTKGGKEISEN